MEGGKQNKAKRYSGKKKKVDDFTAVRNEKKKESKTNTNMRGAASISPNSTQAKKHIERRKRAQREKKTAQLHRGREYR
jgi:hypothetical protein